jgi:hypothetical protein
MPAASTIVTTAKRIPWKRVMLAAALVYRKGSAAARALTPDERQRLLDLARKSKGRPSNLTERERARARELAGKAFTAARHA